MTLLSSEAKLVALSKAVKEVMFMIQVARSMKISVKFLVMVSADNVEAIFMTSNITTVLHTKHVGTRYKYVN